MNLNKTFFKPESFDFIISNGVLHHTFDTETSFKNLLPLLKPGGYIIIGLYHYYGRLATNLRQFAIKYFGDSLRFSDPRFFGDISDKKKYAWFLDQYKNPLEKSHTLREVIGWFKKYNVEFTSSLPFGFSPQKHLFEKQELPSNTNLYFNEIRQIVSLQQIREGGFFTVIGRK